MNQTIKIRNNLLGLIVRVGDMSKAGTLERGGEKACSLTPTENVRHIFNIISLNRGGHRTNCV